MYMTTVGKDASQPLPLTRESAVNIVPTGTEAFHRAHRVFTWSSHGSWSLVDDRRMNSFKRVRPLLQSSVSLLFQSLSVKE